MNMSRVATGSTGHSSRVGSASPGALMLVCQYAARYAGNFIGTQLAVADVTKRRLGLDTVLVLPGEARAQNWLAEIDASAVRVEILPRELRRRPAALIGRPRRDPA